MAALPTGTLTFLFTDIEGSTRLLQRLGVAYRTLLEEHYGIIRQCVAAHGGIEVATEGDAFFVVFEIANSGVAAAADIQNALADHAWPEASVVRVRAGLHTGEGALGGDNYIGLDVHRAARISNAGHGGQVLISATTHALAGHTPPLDFLDLGERRLKDLDEPERLYQLVVPGLPVEFPPLRTVDARPHNLPALATSLVGRVEDTAAIVSLLRQQRVVSLTGPGGTGKTRLALQVAAEMVGDFSDGVFFVRLAPIADPTLVFPTIAHTLDVSDTDGSVSDVIDFLSNRQMLLVLDNFEQVLDAAPDVSTLIQGAAGLKVLVTSQALLRISGEHDYPVPPLAVPHESDPEAIASSAAVTLFVDRARAADPAFVLGENNAQAVAALVNRLDGLPLALELAAARIRLLSPAAMLERIERQQDILTSAAPDVPERHRTLRSAISWSYQLLSAAEQAAFCRLSVFQGGMTLEAAEEMSVGSPVSDPLSTITSLLDKSLLRHQLAGVSQARLAMLATIRDFGLEQLSASNETENVEERHTDLFLDFAQQAEAELEGQRRALWLERLEQDHDNLRALLTRALDRGDAERGLTVAGSIWRFYQGRGHLEEGRQWLERLLALPAPAPTVARVKGLMALGGIRYWQSAPPEAIDSYQEAVTLARDLGDRKLLADALWGLGSSFLIARDQDEARRCLDEATTVYKDLGDKVGLTAMAAGEAFQYVLTDRFEEAVPPLELAHQLYSETGQSKFMGEIGLALATTDLHLGQPDEARRRSLEALDLAEEIGDLFLSVWALEWLSLAEVALGRVEQGVRLSGAAAAAREWLGGGWGAEVHNLENARTQAAELLEEAMIEEAWQEGLSMRLDDAIAAAQAAADDVRAPT